MLRFCLVIVLMAGAAYSNAQTIARNPVTGETYPLKQWISALPDTFDLFRESSPMRIRLVADFGDLVANKFNEKKRDAGLYYLLNDTLEIHKEIRIQPRGNFRRRNCTFPPLNLDFKKTTFYVPQIQSFEKMKMVTDCVRDKKFEVYLLREYLAYKLYSLLTPFSFNVRLLNVTYEDTSGKFDPYTSYAFIIEDIDDVALRNRCLELDSGKITTQMFEPEELLTFAIFQYMIGNQDWSVHGFKNVKIVRCGEQLSAVPYDFDYSGWVFTHYAEPKRHMGLNTIRDRYYMGACTDRETLNTSLQKFLSVEKAMVNQIASFSYLDEADRADLDSYLQSFYQQIEQRNAWRFFELNCK